MQSLLFATALFLAIFHFGLRPKWKADKKVFWVGVVFAVSGYALTCIIDFQVRPPSLLLPFEIIVKALTGQN